MNPFRLSARVLKVLAHAERLRLLYALRDGEECVCHLTALLRRRQAYVSQQLMFLRQAGLLADRQVGLRVYYRIKDARVFALLDAANALTGAQKIAAEPRRVAACPCPKCDAKQKPDRSSRSDRFAHNRNLARRKKC